MEEYECFHLVWTFLVTQIFGMVAFFYMAIDCFLFFAKRILGNKYSKMSIKQFRAVLVFYEMRL